MTYYPLMKTRDAELRAYNKLSNEVKNLIVPIFELTKSRKTTKAPDGDIHRKMTTLRELLGEREFILDVTQVEKYTNQQIENLFDEKNGFYEWQFFLSTYSDMNIIPSIHLYDDEDFTEVEAFVTWASQRYKKLALKLPVDLDDPSVFIRPILGKINNDCKLLVIFDAEFIPESDQIDITNDLDSSINIASRLLPEENIIAVSTTYPRSPAELGEDHEGRFAIRELEVFRQVSADRTIQYGDYASIHPLQYEMRGGTWVPRVDVSLSTHHIYTRYRRADNGYVTAAKAMLSNPHYLKQGCWGDDEIAAAGGGNPGGKSPAYWISVRMNIHMTRRAYEFSSPK